MFRSDERFATAVIGLSLVLRAEIEGQQVRGYRRRLENRISRRGLSECVLQFGSPLHPLDGNSRSAAGRQLVGRCHY